MSLAYAGLCEGYGGLTDGVMSVLPGKLVWYSEFDPAPSKILAHHHPGVPNHGDLTKIDWASLPRVDVMTAGYPCQPFSHAGKRMGTDDPRHLWPHIAHGISILRPRLLALENVRGHLSLGFDEVVRDLHQLGYEVTWYLLRAADIGAPHGRARLFIFGRNRGKCGVCGGIDRRGGVHWDLAHSGGHVQHPGSGGDGDQGFANPRQDASCVRRSRVGDEAGVGAERSQDALDRGRSCGGGVSGPSGASSDPQGRAGEDGSADVGRFGGEPSERRQEALDAGAQGSMRSGEAQDARPERPRASGPDAATAGRDASGDLPMGSMVGAGGRPVRPGGVPGEVADVWADDLRPCVCEPIVAGADASDFLFATPADARGIGGLEAVEHDGRGAQAGHRSGVPDEPDRDALRAGPLGGLTLLPTPRTSDTNGAGHHGQGGPDLRTVAALLPTPGVAGGGKKVPEDAKWSGNAAYKQDGTKVQVHLDYIAENRIEQDWREYEPAIRRWEALTRPAPPPTEPGAKGQPRLSPLFVEWLMGLPAGHVTDPAIGISRNDQLKALGNGVCPAQCAAATRAFLSDIAQEVAA